MIWFALKRVGPAGWAGTLLAATLAVIIVANSWMLPILNLAERWLHDLRTGAYAPVVDVDSRIVIVAFDEDSLAHTQRRSPLDRAILARVLRFLDASEPVAIGIDIMLDQETDADEELYRTLGEMETPVVLAYASRSHTPKLIRAWQAKHLDGVFVRLGLSVSPGAIYLVPDTDGVIRLMPSPPAETIPTFAAALARWGDGMTYTPEVPIVFRRGHDGGSPFLTLPIHALDRTAGQATNMLAQVVRGRIVLIGAMLENVDRHRTPPNIVDGARMSGLEIHGHILAQLLDRVLIWQPEPWIRWSVAVAVTVLGFAIGGMGIRPAYRIVAAVLGIVLLWWGAIELQKHPGTSGAMLPLAGVTLAWLLMTFIGANISRAVVAEERRFVREALSKYVPPSVARELERHPEKLAIGGKRIEIAILFTDIAGFTTLSERMNPVEVSHHLNAYLAAMTETVHRFGGTLDKYIGDAVVAFWGAPLAARDPAASAISCAVELDRVAQAFSDNLRRQGVDFGHTRIGVNFGHAVVGNFGSGDRFQYTAIGDCVNTAARLEGANKYLGTRILVSADVLDASDYAHCRPMGALILKGRSQPLAVFEPVPEMAEPALTAHLEAYKSLVSGDQNGLRALLELSRQNPADGALLALCRRIERNGGSLVSELEAK